MNMKMIENLTELIIEKRIGKIISNIDITINFDIKKTTHTTNRFVRTDIKGYSDVEISNAEIVEFLNHAKSEIAENIASQNILNNDKFVVKSLEWELACAIIAKQIDDFEWEMLVLTVFRESLENPFRVGKDQLVIWV